MTVPSMAEDMLAFADALGIGRFDLMGWLTGGERAQYLAVGAPVTGSHTWARSATGSGPTEWSTREALNRGAVGRSDESSGPIR